MRFHVYLSKAAGIGLLFGLFLLSPKAGHAQLSTADSVLIQQLITDFQTAIVEKDSLRFNKLFFSPTVSFVGIMSKETEGSIQKDYPEFQGVAVSNQRKFIREICVSDKPQREAFYEVETASDGVIANVAFDYAFYSGARMMQWGHEKWNLVKEGNTWLITDVVYTIRFPVVEPFPYP